MSSSGISVDSAAGAPLSITGLGSGLDTTSIISAMMAAERAPVTHLSDEQMKVQAQQTALKGIQSSLQQLAFAASEFTLPSLFESSQAVTSSEPLRVSATTSTGAGIGGYEVEVTQLANSAQRTFTFTSPEAEDTVTIDGQEYALKAGASAKELASKINSSSTATVYAAALENGTVVLSSRSTGNTGTEFIQVSDTGGALSEVVGTAKEGKDAEFTVDGVAGTSSSNTVTTAIAGVTLSLEGLTPSGPVTIDVQAPGPSAAKVEAQVQAFVKQYNTTVEEIEQQVNTKPLSKPHVAGEYAIGILFGDEELTNLLSTMRRTMYEPIAGLSAEMSSPADVGVSTGAPTGTTASHTSIEGLLKLEPSKLTEAVQSNPSGAATMLQQWSQSLQGIVNAAGAPGGAIDATVTGDTSQISELTHQISNMNEILAVREKALQETFAQLEAVISQNTAQGNFIASQVEGLTAQKL
jgi:flagellar hook-associated protein 2